MTTALNGYQAPKLDEPLVVLSYAYSGVIRLRAFLEELPGVTWVGADLVTSCGQLAADWQQVEGGNGAMSHLARKSITTMVNTMLTTHLIGKGALRYCIPADGASESAGRFALLYPKAKFLCLHRTLLDVVYSAVAANPWGLGGGPCGQFAVAYPGNTVAAAAAYWAQCSGRLLAFERAFPGQTLRLRYEDLDAEPADTAHGIGRFAGLPGAPGGYRADGAAPGPAPVGCGAQVPVERIPPALLPQVNDLLSTLGYELLPAR